MIRTPISRIMAKSLPAVKNNLLYDNKKTAMQEVISKQIMSRNMIDEIGFVKDNARRISNGNCPSVPGLCFSSEEKKNQKTIPGWGKIQQEYLSPWRKCVK